MADPEKLTALKKAYADIILNTAKEAAARIMASEKKAQRYQRELFAAKDGGLRMLLRLKQMLDAKVSEAEITSLSYQRRIEELEAQLGEAEDIVKDLRAELSEAQGDLEKLKDNLMRPSENQNSDDINTQVTAFEEKSLSTSGPVISSIPAAQFDSAITLDMKSSSLNATYDDNKCHGENGSHKDNCFVCNPDFSSIMMRSKEPELYRNGCTQRIRAFEGNLLGGSLSLSGQADGAKNQTFITEDGKDTHKSKKIKSMADNLCVLGKWPDEDEVMQSDGHCIQDHVLESFLRKTKRKGATKYKRHKGLSFKSFTELVVDNDVKSGNHSVTIENIADQELQTPVTPKSPSYTNEIIMQSGSLEDTKNNAEFVKSCTARNQNTAIYVKPLVNDPVMPGQEAGSAKSSEAPTSKTDFEIAHMLLEKTDLREPDASEVRLTQPINNKFLKYTFSRKRKKGCLSSPDWDPSLDNITSDKNLGKKMNSSLDSQKSSLIIQSSRDNRRLAHVARKLVSLSRRNAGS